MVRFRPGGQLLQHDIPDRSGRATISPVRHPRRRRVILAVVVVLIVAFGAATARLFVWPRCGIPAHVDAVVMLDGPGDRLTSSFEIAAARRATYLVISQGSVAAGNNPHCPYGFPHVRVICFHPDPPTTRGEAEYTAGLAARYHWHSVALVAITPQLTPALLRLDRCYAGRTYGVKAPLPLVSWPYEVAYEWGALINAELFQRGC